ncbi:hypothetical protein SO802_027828 [Lithocarpus litseifolius]|uniref:Uncharacterized protein n=1 Tax=Lithocarpus litseifolius TaxID=425828 RepID=A0AAW2BS71_9ROSI
MCQVCQVPSCLPPDLEGAVRQSSQVELLIPQLQFLDDEGAQAEKKICQGLSWIH